ncbi:MAG: GH116 family glycosyl-hydrolase [Verrucomicrobia bacterium]|nr:GH116 family glycosyl-hydrolase [Verrucomicrobiota bacterium]
MNQHPNRRKFLRTISLNTAAGALWTRVPFVATAAETNPALTPEERAKRLAELMDERRLFARGEQRVYRNEHLTAISLPLGGIAAGPLQINGEARRASWQIFKNFASVPMPNSFFAVRATVGGKPPLIRALQTVAEGPFPAMKALSFRGGYPFGWYTFEDDGLPLRASMEVFSPMIPLDEKHSAIPCAIFNLTAENAGKEPVEVSFLATQRNAVGLVRPGLGGNSNRVLREAGATVLHLTSAQPIDSPWAGDMALAAVAPEVIASASWDGLDSLATTFAATGGMQGLESAGPSASGMTLDGALAVPFTLQPGQQRTVSFVLAWHFPNVPHANTFHVGNMYANWWTDALDVARDVTGRLAELTRLTRLYHDTLYASNLPYWLLDRIGSQVAVIRAQTCLWSKTGFFYGWEGCQPDCGCCEGTATHVWGYAQAHARLWPVIGRAMREADAGNLGPEGMLPVRFRHPGAQWQFPAFDGQCSFVMSSYREHLLSAERKWLDRNWPKIKQAMDYLIIRWDASNTPSLTVEQPREGIPDGMLSGPQHGMDGDQGGSSSWMGSMYLGALAAAEKMAMVENDPAAAGFYRKIREAGSVNQDQALFNGEYFIQIPDPVPRMDYVTGCYIDQMLGQWWALQAGLGWLYPPEHVRSAMGALFKYNFHASLHGFQQAPRKFCEDADAGLIQGTWPRGGRPNPPNCLAYTEEIMSGFEYTAACLMIQAGLMREGFTVLRAVADRYDGRLRSGLHPGGQASWGYSGNPFGDDECGKFYARAMAIWSVLIACQGFTHDATAGTIGFIPLWQPEDHSSFFTAAEGWGLFTQQRSAGVQHSKIELRHGRLRLTTLLLAAPKQAVPPQAKVTVNRKPIAATVTVDNNGATIRLDAGTTIEAGNSIEVELR